MNKKFCPKCGATDKPLIKGFCLNCFLQDHPEIVQIDREIEFERCKKCGRIRVKGSWVEEREENLMEIVLSKLKLKEFSKPEIEIDFEWLDEASGNYKAEIKVKGEIDNQKVEVKRETLLKAKTVVCDPCMRLTSQYHEAILQIRGGKETAKKEFQDVLLQVNSLLATEEKKDSLAKVVELHWKKNGFDVWIGSKHAAKIVAEKLAKKFKSKVTVSSKLLGRDREGREKYRFTFCVRLKEKEK